MRNVEERESLDVLRGAAVVGLTTTGAAKYQNLVRQLGPPSYLVIAPPSLARQLGCTLLPSHRHCRCRGAARGGGAPTLPIYHP